MYLELVLGNEDFSNKLPAVAHFQRCLAPYDVRAACREAGGNKYKNNADMPYPGHDSFLTSCLLETVSAQ